MFRPSSTVLRHYTSSWAAVVHWSALMPKALRSSKKHPHPLFFLPPPPHTARAPHQFYEHYALRESRILHARHKSRKQDPRPAQSRLDALRSRLDKRVQIGNWMVGAIVLTPTEAASQKSVVGPTQPVVVARVRAPRDAAVKHCIENLGS